MTKDSAVVLLSGGQDSTTCLFWAKERFGSVHPLTIYYGQRHESEIQAARSIVKLAGIQDHLVLQDSILANLVSSALLQRTETQSVTEMRENTNLPATFVPGRNLFFATAAAAYAYEIGANHVVLGVCETDYSGYPDCREHTLRTLEQALRYGIWGEEPHSASRKHQLWLHTPLMYKTKAESVQMARELPGCWEALAHTVTCYLGRRPGCGECPACVLRHRGFEEAGEDDPANEIH